MDQTWNRCLAAGTLALVVGVGGSLATRTESAPPCKASAASAVPLVSWVSPAGAPLATREAMVERVTRGILCAIFC